MTRCFALMLWALSGCGLEVVELAPSSAQEAEIIVVGSLPKSAIDRFERERARDARDALVWRHPEDEAAVPDDGAPLPFVWEAAKSKDKPSPMEPKPEPMAGEKPPKPAAPMEASEVVYELRLRSEAHEARIYTRETQAAVPASTWRSLLAGQRDRELELHLRALSTGAKGNSFAAVPRRLAIRAGAREGALYFRTQGMQPLARAGFGADKSENLGLECRDPAITVASSAGRLGVRCDDRARIHELPSLAELGAFESLKEIDSMAFDASGTRLLRAYRNIIEIVGLDGALVSRIEFELGVQVADASWSPDGATIAFAYWERSVMAASPDAPGASIAVVPAGPSGAAPAPTLLARVETRELTHRFPRFSPDGQLLAYVRGKGELAKLDQAALVFVSASSGAPKLEAMIGGAMGKRSGPGQHVWIPSVRPAAWWIVYASGRESPFMRPGDRAQLWASWLDVGAGDALALSPAIWLPLQDPTTENTQPEWASAP